MNMSLTFSPVEAADVDCPPKDTYVLELKRFGDFEERGAYQDPTMVNIQSRITFQIVEFDYDEDLDERDWNGVEVSDFFVFYKQKQGEQNRRETWKDERSNAYKLISALIGHTPEDGEEISLNTLLDKRIKATVEPKASGWPKISEPLPYRKKRRKAAPVPEPEDDTFDDD